MKMKTIIKSKNTSKIKTENKFHKICYDLLVPEKVQENGLSCPMVVSMKNKSNYSHNLFPKH